MKMCKKKIISYLQTVNMTHHLPYLFDRLLTNISNPKVTKVTRIGSLVASFPALLNVSRHFILGATNFYNVRNNIHFILINTNLSVFLDENKKSIYVLFFLLYNCTLRYLFLGTLWHGYIQPPKYWQYFYA
jgi:hypothetical protein